MTTPSKPRKVWVVAHEDYVSEVKAAFTNKRRAEAHANKTGGIAVPVMLFDGPIESKIYHVFVTSIERPSGLVIRTDVGKHTEWVYDEPIADLTTTLVGSRGNIVVTRGYDYAATEETHNEAIKANGGVHP